jgi:hypothetical protein
MERARGWPGKRTVSQGEKVQNPRGKTSGSHRTELHSVKELEVGNKTL